MALCDGSGWPDLHGAKPHGFNTRVYAVSGDPPQPKFEYLSGSPDLYGEAYPKIIPKWMAPDGKSFWLVWTDFQVIDNKRPLYAYNLQKVEVLTDDR
jgi:hypothetical protein